jgi:hypothetical protein
MDVVARQALGPSIPVGGVLCLARHTVHEGFLVLAQCRRQLVHAFGHHHGHDCRGPDPTPTARRRAIIVVGYVVLHHYHHHHPVSPLSYSSRSICCTHLKPRIANWICVLEYTDHHHHRHTTTTTVVVVVMRLLPSHHQWQTMRSAVAALRMWLFSRVSVIGFHSLGFSPSTTKKWSQ